MDISEVEHTYYLPLQYVYMPKYIWNRGSLKKIAVHGLFYDISVMI